MFVPILMVTLGGIMVYSALTGLSITDVISGKSGSKLNPQGHAASAAPSSSGTSSYPSSSGKWTAPSGQSHSFKGPHATDLDNLAGIAQNQFHLTITSTNGSAHVPTSLHYQGKAFDAAGSTADMKAFAQYVLDHFGNTVSELIHNPGYAVKDGRMVNGSVFYGAVWAGHTNHVHVGMA